MMTRDTYLDKVKTQLKGWHTDIETLKAKTDKIQPAVKRKMYYDQLQIVSAKQALAQQKLQDLSLAGRENWDALKAEVEQSLIALRGEFTRLRQIGQEAGYEVLSWAKGIADKHVVESIGWAEGIAKEDPIESIGWAEGIAKEDKIESIGWAEGYEQDKGKT